MYIYRRYDFAVKVLYLTLYENNTNNGKNKPSKHEYNRIRVIHCKHRVSKSEDGLDQRTQKQVFKHSRCKKRLKIPKGLSEFVNRRRRDNKIAKIVHVSRIS